MNISISENDGSAYFPGLSTPHTVEVGTLSEQDQQELRQLIAA